MLEKAQVMDEKAMARTLTRISYEIIERNRGAADLCIIGILEGGAEIARRIAQKIADTEGMAISLGSLDITPFRDDRKGEKGLPDRSCIDFSVQDRQVVLVDDVLFTGRSVRAAIDAIMSRGRPRSIQLAVLVDRGHRELPIRPDYIGKNLPTALSEMIRVRTKQRDGLDAVHIMEKK
jgi:pyrimidine operon attenuation protein/uracil phosphoribosyltransferase